jgi:hypothetical protein
MFFNTRYLISVCLDLTDDQIGRATKLDEDKDSNKTTKKSFIYLLYKDKRRNEKVAWHLKSPCSKTFHHVV